MPKSQAEFVSFCHKQKTFSVEQVARYLRCNPTELIGVLKIHANLHTTDQTQVSSETLSNLKEAILKIKSLGKYQFPKKRIPSGKPKSNAKATTKKSKKQKQPVQQKPKEIKMKKQNNNPDMYPDPDVYHPFPHHLMGHPKS